MPTGIWSSRWRSGSAHWDLELAVEVRQCPLGSGLQRAWRRVGKAEVEVEVDADIVEEKLEEEDEEEDAEEEENSSDKI